MASELKTLEGKAQEVSHDMHDGWMTSEKPVTYPKWLCMVIVEDRERIARLEAEKAALQATLNGVSRLSATRLNERDAERQRVDELQREVESLRKLQPESSAEVQK